MPLLEAMLTKALPPPCFAIGGWVNNAKRKDQNASLNSPPSLIAGIHQFSDTFLLLETLLPGSVVLLENLTHFPPFFEFPVKLPKPSVWSPKSAPLSELESELFESVVCLTPSAIFLVFFSESVVCLTPAAFFGRIGLALLDSLGIFLGGLHFNLLNSHGIFLGLFLHCAIC